MYTLTNENVLSGTASCPYGTVSGSWESSERVWNGGNWGNPSWTNSGSGGYVHYRCGDLGQGQGSYDWGATIGSTQSMFGQQVHPLGDTNNDTYGDILVTSPNWSTGTYTERGRVFIFRGTTKDEHTTSFCICTCGPIWRSN